MICSDPKNFNYTDSVQPHRAKKDINLSLPQPRKAENGIYAGCYQKGTVRIYTVPWRTHLALQIF